MCFSGNFCPGVEGSHSKAAINCDGVMDLEGTVVERWCGKTPNHGVKVPCGYSLNKAQIAFGAIPDGEMSFPVTEEESRKGEVYVANADGSNVRRLTFNDYSDGHCSW